MKTYKNILVIKMSSLGDIVHALPCLYELRKLYPEARISWLVEPQFQDILPGMPYLDEKIIFYKNNMKKMSLLGKIGYLRDLRKQLHAYDFDLVIDLQGLMKSTLVALLTGCKNRIGYCEMREGSRFFTKAICGPHAGEHVVQRYLDVMRYLGAKVNEAVFPMPEFAKESETSKTILSQAGVTGKYAVFFPGSRWLTKEWPIEYYAELAQKISDENIAVIIAGGKEDIGKGKKIKDIAQRDTVIDLTGKTSINEVAALVKDTVVCLGGDTGPMHVAAAFGTPTISLFGPVSPKRTGAYGKKSSFIVTAADCAPCFKRVCPRKNFICMPGIKVEQVFVAVQKNFLMVDDEVK